MANVGATDSSKAPGSAASTIARIRFADDGAGRLVMEDTPGVTEIPFVDDGTGRLVLDDTQTSGLLYLWATPLRIFAYDTP